MAVGENTLQAKTAVLEQRADQHDKYFDRIDASVEKLTEVSISLKEIVKSQEAKHAATADTHRELYRMIDERRRWSEEAQSRVYDKIETVKSGLNSDIEAVAKEFTDSLSTIAEKVRTNDAFLEKYKWLIIGAGGILFFLLDKFPIIESIFGISIPT